MKSTEDIIGLLNQEFDFENFLSGHIVGLLLLQKDGTILSADQRLAGLAGYETEQLTGRAVTDLLPSIELPQGPFVEEAFAQGQVTGRHRSGKRMDFSYTLRQSIQYGEPSFFVMLHQRSSVSKSLEIYAHMFDWMPVGILIYDRVRHRPVRCNQELLRMLEADDEKKFIEEGPFSANSTQPEVFQYLRDKIATLDPQEHQQFELTVISGQGNGRCLEVSTALIPALNESLNLLVFKDITQKRIVDNQLRESQNKLESVINTAVDGIVIIDERGVIQMVNEAVCKLFGFSRQEMQGQNVSLLMPEPHRSSHDTYIDNYHRTGIQKIIGIGREVEGRRKDGTLFPFKLGVSRVQLQDEVLFAGVIHDLTEQKKAEAEILRLNKELEQKVEERTEKLTEVVNKLLQSNLKLEREIKERKAAEAALRQNEEELRKSLEKEKELSELKSRFVSMASHEFRTPLTTIASSSELIGLYNKAEQQEKREKHLKRISSAVTNLTGILGDFLSLSKLEEGKIQNEPVRFNLQDLAEEVSGEMQSLLRPRQRLEVDFHHLSREIILDKKLVKNILINLLSNAIKYSGEGTAVQFYMALEDNTIRASIQDEGIGIPEADQKHLFSRFFRAANSVNIQGTGLGLNIVKRYLDLLKGDISFKSEENKGTTFYLSIPISEQGNKKAPTEDVGASH